MAHAADRTAINCHKMDCRWNDHGECAAAQILVDEGPVCLTYEPMAPPLGAPMGAGLSPAGLGPPPMAPPLPMGAGAGGAPEPGPAPQGAGGPGLAGLLMAGSRRPMGPGI